MSIVSIYFTFNFKLFFTVFHFPFHCMQLHPTTNANTYDILRFLPKQILIDQQ